MDGTLVDTEPYWIEAEKALVTQHGGTWSDEDALQLVGNALDKSALLLQKAGVAMSVPEIIDWLTARVIERTTAHIPWRPGAHELIEELYTAGIPSALVTMSFTELATIVQEALGPGRLEFIVTGDQVSNGKPHPEAYLTALDRLASSHGPLEPRRVVAIEDSFPGVSSAIASGVVTIAIPHTVPLPEHLGDVQWTTLAGKRVADLEDAIAAVQNVDPS